MHKTVWRLLLFASTLRSISSYRIEMLKESAAIPKPNSVAPSLPILAPVYEIGEVVSEGKSADLPEQPGRPLCWPLPIRDIPPKEG